MTKGSEPIGDGDIGRKTMHQLLPSNPIAPSLMGCDGVTVLQKSTRSYEPIGDGDIGRKTTR